MIMFHNKIGEEFLAGGLHGGGGGFGAVGFEVHGDVFADAHVGHAVDVNVGKIFSNGFALWVEEFPVGHDVNFGCEFHTAMC